MYDLTWIDWMLAAALIAMLAALAATVVVAIRTTEPADDGPLLVDVDAAGDATEVLPPDGMPELTRYQRAVDDLDTDEIPPPPVDPAPAPVRRTLSPHWRDLIDPTIPTLTAHPTDSYLGRHSEESIEMRLPVAPGWMPPVGRHRIAAAVDGTELMPAVQA